jgi:hypothetical protein
MDDLDRLYRHLVDTLRAEAPHLLRQRFAVGDLAQQLVPYRLHRRALGFDAIQQYDQALLRLVAGERGYLLTEPVVRDAAREALARGPADGDALRRFADAPAALAPEPLASLGGVSAPAPVAPMPLAPMSSAPRSSAAPMPPAPAATTAPDRSTSGAAGVPMSPPLPPPPATPRDQPPPPPMPFPARPPAAVVGGRCQYCGHALPEGRPVTFCPYCGQNVTVVRCPACSTELEVGWRFCVTCGRAMDGAESDGAGARGGAPGS